MIPRGELDFLPSINWRFWGPILAVPILFAVVWITLRRRELERSRAALLREHAALTGEIAPGYRATRDRIETAILQSVGPWQGDLRDPSFTLDALTREPPLYARTRLGEIHDRNDLPASVRHRYPDQFAACLGVESQWARELLDKGAFLREQYVDSVRGADTPERVTALRADLRTRLTRDRGFITEAMRRPYLVVLVDEAPLSIEGPTRVYVYDLRGPRAVLRARGEGNDLILVPFRIGGVPAPAPSAARSRTPTVSQHDCSVANTVRSALGVSPMGILHTPPEPESPPTADASSPTDAAAADAR